MFKIYWTRADGVPQSEDEELLTDALRTVKEKRMPATPS